MFSKGLRNVSIFLGVNVTAGELKHEKRRRFDGVEDRAGMGYRVRYGAGQRDEQQNAPQMNAALGHP